MDRRSLTILAFTVIIGSGVLVADGGGKAKAQNTSCDARVLNGGYGIMGTGAFGDQEMGLVGTLLFDGAGGVSGHGTTVVHAPAIVEHLVLSEGRYTVNADCTGSIRFFTHHVNLGAIDHYHVVDLVVSDAGHQISLVYVTTEFRDGAPSAPVESFTIWGHQM